MDDGLQALAAGYQSVGQWRYPHRRYVIETFLAAAQDVTDVEVPIPIPLSTSVRFKKNNG